MSAIVRSRLGWMLSVALVATLALAALGFAHKKRMQSVVVMEGTGNAHNASSDIVGYWFSITRLGSVVFRSYCQGGSA